MMQHAQLLAAFAIRAEEREVTYDLAGHLAYLADRLCLARHNFPVVSDRRVAVMGGAVNCGVMRTVFDGFNPDIRSEPMFSEVGPLSCRLSRHIVHEDLDLMSVATTRVIADVWSAYAPLGTDGIAALMSDRRQFPEIPSQGLGEDISLGSMLDSLGFDDAKDIAVEIEAHERLDRIFSIISVR
jgi:hypothetical protein